MARWLPLLLVVVALLLDAGTAAAAIGDVSFRVSSTEVSVPAGTSGGIAASVDVFADIEGGGSIPAAGWAAIFEITPSTGAFGSIAFNPTPITAGEPNLLAASENPFVDFDRDFGGMSYGELGDTTRKLHAVAAYVPPTTMAPPTLDAHGNVTLTDSAGLVSLPLLIAPNASGDFIISIVANPQLSSVLARTANPPPDNTMIHPSGSHVAGTISVERVFTLNGDYNADGSVDAADYVVWRKNDGTSTGHSLWRVNFGRAGPAPAALGDFNADGSVNTADYVVWRKTDGTPAGYDLWRANFGRAVPSGPAAGATSSIPEPVTLIFVILEMLFAGVGWRHRSTRRDFQERVNVRGSTQESSVFWQGCHRTLVRPILRQLKISQPRKSIDFRSTTNPSCPALGVA